MAGCLTQEEKEKIIQLYNDGYNTVQTGEILNSNLFKKKTR